ncbi:hypothetical protein FM112_15040 [Gulosibacter sp. 10]|nr:hypothetical protein FM112_15040 [Gulosibacter sp. 10]
MSCREPRSGEPGNLPIRYQRAAKAAAPLPGPPRSSCGIYNSARVRWAKALS